jgi:hypothetical protein
MLRGPHAGAVHADDKATDADTPRRLQKRLHPLVRRPPRHAAQVAVDVPDLEVVAVGV